MGSRTEELKLGPERRLVPTMPYGGLSNGGCGMAQWRSGSAVDRAYKRTCALRSDTEATAAQQQSATSAACRPICSSVNVTCRVDFSNSPSWEHTEVTTKLDGWASRPFKSRGTGEKSAIVVDQASCCIYQTPRSETGGLGSKQRISGLSRDILKRPALVLGATRVQQC